MTYTKKIKDSVTFEQGFFSGLWDDMALSLIKWLLWNKEYFHSSFEIVLVCGQMIKDIIEISTNLDKAFVKVPRTSQDMGWIRIPISQAYKTGVWLE